MEKYFFYRIMEKCFYLFMKDYFKFLIEHKKIGRDCFPRRQVKVKGGGLVDLRIVRGERIVDIDNLSGGSMRLIEFEELNKAIIRHLRKAEKFINREICNIQLFALINEKEFKNVEFQFRSARQDKFKLGFFVKGEVLFVGFYPGVSFGTEYRE